MHDRPVYFPPSGGHCTRCRKPFAADAPAFMVRELVGYGLIGSEEKGYAYLGSEWATVPVCEPCGTVKEQADAGQHGQKETVCKSCGIRMIHCDWSYYRRHNVCTPRCAQRVRRRARREQRPEQTCTVCKTMFQPKRADAKFCSSACRQWAYRLRKFAPR
jgi:hypothetical protein